MSGFITLPQIILGAAVADAGTLTASYPAGTDEGHFTFNRHHKLMMNSAEMAFPDDFTLTFGTSNITITNGSGSAWPVGARLYLQLDKAGINDADSEPASPRVSKLHLIQIDLGAPDTPDVNGVIEAFSETVGEQTLDGALATDGVVTFDVPRNIVVDSGGADTAVLTFTGTDEFGNVLVESIQLNGVTAVLGKKAFKTITGLVTTGATTANGAFAGPGDILGLPFFMRSLDHVVLELADNVIATAGTMIGGVLTAPSATTGDVRGTYLPDTVGDGAIVLSLIVAVSDPKDIGLAQYAG